MEETCQHGGNNECLAMRCSRMLTLIACLSSVEVFAIFPYFIN